jgi:hypothetical protein
MSDLRIVLKGSDTNYKMDLLAWQQNWEFYDFQPKNEIHMYKIWKTRDGETVIQYMEDYYANIRYLAIVGRDADEIAEKIRSTFDFYTLDELLQLAKQAREKGECIGVIIRLAAASPKLFEPEIFRVFERMFSHEDPEVREATAFATTYRAWLEFRKPLERLIENDPDQDMREYAQATLRSLMKIIAKNKSE